MKFLFGIILTLYFSIIYSQSKQLDFQAIDYWPSVNGGKISPNGKTFMYNINYGRSGKGVRTRTIFQQDNWQLNLTKPSVNEFMDNGDILVLSMDTLMLIKPLSGVISKVTGVKFAKLFTYRNKSVILCQYNSPNKQTVIFDDHFNVLYSRSWFHSSFLSGDESKLFLRFSDSLTDLLLRFDLNDTSKVSIDIPKHSKDLIANFDGKKLAYLNDDNSSLILWQYEKNAVMIKPMRKFSTLIRFSQDSKRIFCTLADEKIKEKKSNIGVDVWNHHDPVLQSALAMKSNKIAAPLIATFNLNNERIIQLSNRNQQFGFLDGDDFGWLNEAHGDFIERYWNDSSYVDNYLVNLSTGDKIKMDIDFPLRSLDGKYLVGVTMDRKYLYFYDLTAKNFKSYPPNVFKININENDIQIGGWCDDGDLILYDKFDILKVHPKSWKLNNLTRILRENKPIVYRIAEKPSDNGFEVKQLEILCSFNMDTKENRLVNTATPVKDMEYSPFFYGMRNTNEMHGLIMLKAERENAWLVQRESSQMQPNLFVTSDFNTYRQISNINNSVYKMPTIELAKYKDKEGRQLYGLLYKPSSFTENKKYPVIFNYYEIRSQHLNQFIYPNYAKDEINIPWMCSQEYVVFVPDMVIEKGNLGNSIMKCINAGYNWVSSFKWADTSRFALCGHSFGGYETQLIITRTNKFAAAVSSSGMSDLISLSGEVTLEEGIPFQRFWAETGQGNLGATLWERPDLYIDNSPLLSAHRITTPLLMMNNKLDGVVNFSQGIEMFTALRRLKKPVWMLQYDGEGHSLSIDDGSKDYTVRLDQFYDHFLKGNPLPGWLIKGVDLSNKKYFD
jgi:hypothetical protein